MSSDNNIMNGKTVIKSGFWYTISSVICKSIGFLTIPIIIRILGVSNYGLYSNFQSWLGTFTILICVSLSSSLISAKYDYIDKFDKYIESILILEVALVLLWSVVFFIFIEKFKQLTHIDSLMIFILLIDCFFISVVDLFQHRAIFKLEYKSSVLVNISLSVLIAVLSIILAYLFTNSLYGAVIGYSIPYVIVGIILIFFLIYKGRGVFFDAWKYSLRICLPYVPHLLSLTLLNSLDKMMITNIRGSKENAMYSVAYNCGIIITILGSAVNSAFSPWLGDKLHSRQLEEIRKVTKIYVSGFAVVTVFVMLLGPELIFIMGDKVYMESVGAIIPIVIGCLFQFVYTIFVDVEQFEKKTKGMAVASIIAALSNYVLNSIYIPKYGYIAAAYTTLISYCILLILHIILVWRLELLRVCSIKYLLLVFSIVLVLAMGINVLYKCSIVRWGIIVFLFVVVIIAIIVFRKKIKELLLLLIKK